METQLYSIFDVKAVRFLKLFQAENHAVAIVVSSMVRLKIPTLNVMLAIIS